MDVHVDIRKTLTDRGRCFTLQTQFASDQDYVVLFGPSGAGKSLTLQAIAGLVRPDAGHIRLGDHTLFDTKRGIDVPVRQRHVGFLFQDYALFPHLSVAENVGFGLRRLWQWRPAAADRKRVEEMLDIFELRPLAAAMPRHLSGGQRQRAALARALIAKPDILLLDEPFAALNPLLRARMRTELLRIREHFDVPVILITHDQEDVETFGETLVMVEDGAVRGVWPFKSLRDRQSRGAGEQGALERMRRMLEQSGLQGYTGSLTPL